MASQPDICNLALVNLGQSPDITSINPPDGTKYAAAAAQFYPIALDKILGDACCLFSIRIDSLNSVSDTPPAAWGYAYALPSLMVKPLMLQDAEQPDPNIGIDYMIMDGILYCNSSDVVMRYVYRNTNTAEYTNAFVIAFGALLAHFLAAPVTKDPNMSAYWMKMYQSYLAAAMLDNSQRYYYPDRYDCPSISARNA